MNLQTLLEPNYLKLLDNAPFIIKKGRSLTVFINSSSIFSIAKRFVNKVNEIYAIDILISAYYNHESTGIVLSIDETSTNENQGYSLSISPQKVDLRSNSLQGLQYATATLLQILRIVSHTINMNELKLPAMEVQDSPKFQHRGVMLDISRDRVPSMGTLFDLIDTFADWKINQLQLYIEHTFAYNGHEVVWKNSSPITPQQMMELDVYCKERFIELVPNQNSFGHMHRWLIHEPYRQLAECPDGIEHPFSKSKEPYSLCPIDEGSFKLLEDLYSQLLPHFTSKQFNVGLDETFDLGKGRSKDLCDKEGKKNVYISFLKRVHEMVTKKGYTMQYWGDIILETPEVIPQLPNDTISLLWGYSANHPFDKDCPRFKENGLRFYVCPGTSSWNSIVGRTTNCLQNLKNAAIYGSQNGAEGYLNTDWGDNGHMQPLTTSYLGFFMGAMLAWNPSASIDRQVVIDRLNTLVFHDKKNKMGASVYDIGDCHKLLNDKTSNSNLFGRLLANGSSKIPTTIEIDQLNCVIDKVEKEIKNLQDDKPDTGIDTDIILNEWTVALRMVLFACRLAIARIEKGNTTEISGLDEVTKESLSSELRWIIDNFSNCWKRRHRIGGLSDSLSRIESTLYQLKQ